MSIISQPDLGLILDVDPQEIWNYTQCKKGDHIRVSRGLYSHHGVYISDEEVIHFTGTDDDSVLDWSKCEVIKTDIDDFLCCGTLEVKEYTEEELDDLYPVEHIVHYARVCLGDAGYNLVINNCEHFANMCTLGRFRSKQVERVFDIILRGGSLPKKRRGNDMGFFNRVGDAWNAFLGNGKSSGGGRTSTANTYNYEPDKVKVAEIEADTRLRLADRENERIELMKNARLDMLEFEYKSNIALEEAKARGLNYMTQTILDMQEKLNEVAEKRLAIIEKGSLQIIKEIEGFYDELGNKIKADDDAYNTDKLPQLLHLLEGYEIGTPSHELYRKRIDDDMMLQVKHYTMQIDSISKRQSQIIEGFLQSKERIVEQTGKITAGILENIASRELSIKVLDGAVPDKPMLEEKRSKMLESPKGYGEV